MLVLTAPASGVEACALPVPTPADEVRRIALGLAELGNRVSWLLAVDDRAAYRRWQALVGRLDQLTPDVPAAAVIPFARTP
jgi:hypothetical protein